MISESGFEALRFRHAGLDPEEVVRASLRLMEFMPKVGERIQRFREHTMDARESLDFASQALLLRYPTLEEAPVEAETLLKARRPEDEGSDLWATMNRCQENLIRGGVSDFHRDKRGRLRSVRVLRGIDSKVGVNKGVWNLAEQVANGEPLTVPESVSLPA